MTWTQTTFLEVAEYLSCQPNNYVESPVRTVFFDNRWTLPPWLYEVKDKIEWVGLENGSVLGVLSRFDINAKEVEPAQFWIGTP